MKVETMGHNPVDDPALGAVGSATIWDATEHRHGGFAITHRTIETLHALRANDRAVGPAYTIRMRRAKASDPANRAGFLAAYDKAPKDAVVVVEVQSDIGGVAMGDVVAHRLSQCGVAGVVINGAIRDQAGLLDLAPPTWYRYTTPAGPVSREVTVEVGVDVVVGGAVISSGDLIMADADGVMVMPAAEADGIIAEAKAIVEKEAVIHERLQSGESMQSILMGIKA